MVKRSFSSLTESYLQTVEQECSFLSIGDDAVPLDRVYVMLEALTSPKPRLLEPRPDLPDVPKRQEHAGLENFPKAEPPPTPLPLSKVLAAARHLSLLGEPGSGKSTTLQFISLCFARHGWANAKLALDEPGVPVLVKLGETGDLLLRPETRLLDGVVIPIVRGLLPEGTTEPEAHDVVMDWMAQGRLVLLLDGLDELSGDAIRKKITLFASDPNGRKCRMVLSSRPAGYSSPGGEFTEYRLKPFEKPEEAQSYLQGWLAALRPEWGPQVENKARDLLGEMGRNPALKRITDNPLLLRLAAEGYAADEQVARNRADLYRLYVETVAWERRESTRQTPPEQKTAVLAALEAIAWKLQQGSIIPWDNNDPQHVLLRRQLGLLVICNDAGKAYLTFSHTTFREYFIARRLAKGWQQKESRGRTWAILRPRLHDPAWREPLLLLAGMLEKRTATDLVRRVLKARSRYEKGLFRDLGLAAAMAGERGEENLSEPLWKELQWQLQMSSLHISANVIMEIGVLAIYPQLRALEDEDEHNRIKAALFLGEIGDSEAIPALTRVLNDKNEGDRVRSTVAEFMGKIGGPQAVQALLRALEDENMYIRTEAAKALWKIGDLQAVPALIRKAECDDNDVRRLAILLLRKSGDPQAIQVLLRALKDEDKHVRIAAAEALGGVGDSRAIPVLLQTLEENDDKYGRRR